MEKIIVSMMTMTIAAMVCNGQQQFVYPDQFEMIKDGVSPIPFFNPLGASSATVQSSPPVYVPQSQGFRHYIASSTKNVAAVASPSAIPIAASAPVAASDASSIVPLASAPVPAPASISGASPLVETLPQDWAYRVNDIIAKGVAKLALDIQNTIYSSKVATAPYENVIFSPLNIAGTLAVVQLASAGKTFNEVSQILGLATGVDISRNSELVHQMFGYLMTVVHQKVDKPSRTIDIASAIFIQDGFPIRPEFKTISEEVYKSDVITVDFQRKATEALNRINNWVKDKTMGKISQILNSPPTLDTNVVIASALYFKAEWNQHFIQGATARKPFHIEPDNTINVDMMYNGGNFPFYEDKYLNVKIIGLPYKGLDTTMYVLLPQAQGAKALGEFERTLTPERIEYLIGNMINETCIVGMPRMKLSSSLKLKSVLQSLGLTSLFDRNSADLSLLSPGIGQRLNTLPDNMNPTITTTSSDSYTRPSKSTKNQDVLIFSRTGEDGNNGKMSTRTNFFRYQDKLRGYNVEQWANGFSIKKLTKRNAVIRENAWYFGPAGPRWKRQSRPVSDDFLKVVQNSNFRSYGLDDLRNSATLVNPGLYADDVVHKVEIEINERGTEAAASTAVILRKDGRQKRLIANRPFLFFIRHDPTKLILFWGSINTPLLNYPAT